MDRSAFPLRRPVSLVAALLLAGVLAACGTVGDPLADAPYGEEAPIEESNETPGAELPAPTIGGEPAPEDSVGADLEDAVLEGDFRDHDFSGANLKGASFQSGSFAGALFVDADLRHARFNGGDFRGADFSGADLRGAHLAGADLRGANLSGANLFGAYAPGDSLKLEGAVLAGAIWFDGRVCAAGSVGACD